MSAMNMRVSSPVYFFHLFEREPSFVRRVHYMNVCFNLLCACPFLAQCLRTWIFRVCKVYHKYLYHLQCVHDLMVWCLAGVVHILRRPHLESTRRCHRCAITARLRAVLWTTCLMQCRHRPWGAAKVLCRCSKVVPL